MASKSVLHETLRTEDLRLTISTEPCLSFFVFCSFVKYCAHVDDGYLEYGDAHVQLPHAREDVNENNGRVGFVLGDDVHGAHLRDHAGAHVPSYRGRAYVRVSLSKVI